MNNTARPSVPTPTNTEREFTQETWGNITTTWASETRTWAQTISLMTNPARQTASMTNTSRP